MASALIHAIIVGTEISHFINIWKNNFQNHKKKLTFNSNLNNDYSLFEQMYWDDYSQRH